MNDPSQWPGYPIGPKDSMFAIGVVSANYSRLEFALTGMFATVTGTSMQFASILLPRITNNVRTDLMRRMLEQRDWPADIKDRAEHFIRAFAILAENRNLLMHSNLIATTREITTLYKTTRRGETQLCRVSVEELRRVADDMVIYFSFGLHLSNMINFELLKILPREGDFAFSSWPDKPPLPVALEYTSNPIPDSQIHNR